jgi:hypothetical protein
VRGLPIAACLALAACSFDGSGLGADIGDPTLDGGQRSFDAGAPSSLWWNPAYAQRRRILVSTTSAAAPSQTSVAFDIDTAALVGSGELRSDGFDFRLIRHNSDGSFTELDRWIDDIDGGGWQSPKTLVWFSVPAAIDTDSVDADTYLYYDSPNQSSAPAADIAKAFLFGDDFEDGAGRWTDNGRGLSGTSTLQAQGGAQSLLINDNANTSTAGVYRDQSFPAGNLLFTSYVKQDQTGSSFGFYRVFKEPYADRQKAWLEGAMVGHAELDSGDRLEFVRWTPWLITNWHPGYGVAWHRIDVVADQSGEVVMGRVDSGPWSAQVDMFTSPAGAAIESIALEAEGQGGSFFVDNYIVRRWVDPAPGAIAEAAEQRK